MMTGLKCCLKKDIKEVLRTGKVILFAAMVLGIAVMIMGFTMIFTDIPDALTEQLPGFDISALESMMVTLYPKRVAGSVGVYSYYIGVFLSLVAILVIHSLLPKEIRNGKWVLPLEQGYSKRVLITSKCIVYGLLAFVFVFIGYMLYFSVAKTFMLNDLSAGNAVFLAMIHGLNLFFIITFTLLLSVCFKSSVWAAISMIGTILVAPDIFGMLPFGKYLPTYMLTIVYDTITDHSRVVGPLMLNILLLAFTYIIAVNRVEKLSVSR